MSSLFINDQEGLPVWLRENYLPEFQGWEANEGAILLAIFESIPWWVWLFVVLFLIGFVKRKVSQTAHTLAAEGNIRAFRKIAKSQGNPGLEAVAPDGGTPLYLAAANGHEVGEVVAQSRCIREHHDQLCVNAVARCCVWWATGHH